MTYDNGTSTASANEDPTFNANPDFERTQNNKPMRPGFSNGTEELRWRGKPALRSTSYMWALSIGLALFVSRFIDPVCAQLYKLGATFLATPQGTLNFWVYVIPWVIFLWPATTRTISLMATTYELTNQRFIIRSGILLRTHDQVELFRVRDFMIDAPLYLTVLGLGHIRIISRDETLPLMTVYAQPEAPTLVDVVRGEVLRRKDEVGVREIEAGAM